MMVNFNNIELNYLVFDDENEEENQFHSNVTIAGCECKLNFINPVNFWNKDTNEFELNKFKEELDHLIKGKQINLIASDWNMVPITNNYQEVNALEIIRILVNYNSKFKKVPCLIYSGKLSDATQVLLSEIKNDIESNDLPIQSKELLGMLLEMKIKFCTRNERFSEIKALINNSKTISLIFLNALAKFDHNIVHNTGNECFDGKKIGELIGLSSQDNDLGLKFIREIIELSISHYSKLNE
jgi:hypothetical protein